MKSKHVFFSKKYWNNNHVCWIVRQPNGNYQFATRMTDDIKNSMEYFEDDIIYLGVAEKLSFLAYNIDISPEEQIKKPSKYKLKKWDIYING